MPSHDWRHSDSAANDAERLRLQYERTPAMLHTIDADGRIIAVTNLWLERMGYDRSEVIGHNLIDFVSDESRHMIEQDLLPTVLRAESLDDVPCQMVTKSGRLIDVLMCAHGEFDNDGNLIRVLTVLTDVARHRRVEQDLRDMARRHKEFVDSAPVAIVIDDIRGRMRYFNQHFLDLFGYSRAEMQDMDFSDLAHPDDKQEQLALHRQRLASLHRPASYEFRAVHKNGNVIHVAVECAFIIVNGKAVAARSHLWDITALRQTQQESGVSKSRLQPMLDGAADPIIIHDFDGHILDVNDEACRSLGYSRNELLHLNITDIDHTPLPDALANLQGDSLPGQVSRPSVYHSKDGTSRSVQVSYSTIDLDTGPIVLALARDTSEGHRLPVDFEAAADRLRAILDSTHQSFVLTDTIGRIQTFNAAADTMAVRLTGSHMKAGADVRRYILPSYRRKFERDFSSALVGREVINEHTYTDTVSRSDVFLRMAFHPVVSRRGQVMGVCVNMTDLTEQLHRQMEEINRQKLDSVGLMAGGLARDFDDLLTGILGNLALALSELDEATPLYRELATAEDLAQRAQSLTSRLKTFANGGAPAKTPTDIEPLVREAARKALAGSTLEPEFSFEQELWPVLADSVRCKQAIAIILQNAIDASGSDATAVKIEVTNCTVGPQSPHGLTAGRYVLLQITDHGCGIRQSDLPRVFDPFFTTRADHSGLGLSTAYSIVERHGGKLAIESQQGTGTTVTVYLPAADRSQDGTETATQPDRRASLAGAHILVMDDEPFVRQISRDILLRAGATVTACANGQEAIECYERSAEAGEPFDVLIFDLTVAGGIGGKEALVTLRAKYPNVKAIVCSAYVSDSVMSQFKTIGFCGVVTKPFGHQQLVDEVLRIWQS